MDWSAQAFRQLNQTTDLVFVEQRGTPGSGPARRHHRLPPGRPARPPGALGCLHASPGQRTYAIPRILKDERPGNR